MSFFRQYRNICDRDMCDRIYVIPMSSAGKISTQHLQKLQSYEFLWFYYVRITSNHNNIMLFLLVLDVVQQNKGHLWVPELKLHLMAHFGSFYLFIYLFISHITNGQ